MKVYVPIFFLLLSIAIGASAFILENLTNLQSKFLYVYDDDEKPVRLDLSETYDEPLIEMEDLPDLLDFYLYSRQSNNPEALKIGDVKGLNKSHFDKKKPTKFITHGWRNSRRSKACALVRDAFLKNGDYNVIVIDWSFISMSPYMWASSHVQRIAKVVARMIDFLDSQGASASNMTLVGHSLGAHIAGLSSYYAKKKASYVVGLDPAGPNFHQKYAGSMLTKEDATYVLVIHTSGSLGLMYQLGHADFYPNGGMVQSDCIWVDMGGACSHSRSYQFYAESINNNRFVGRSCDTYTEFLLGVCNSNSVATMGGVTPDTSVKGRYFLTTKWASPFALIS